jgi:hypothetical protein
MRAVRKPARSIPDIAHVLGFSVGRIRSRGRGDPFIDDLDWNTNSVVPHLYLDRVTEIPRRNLWRHTVLIHRSASCRRTKRSKGRSWIRHSRKPRNIRLDKFFPSVTYVTHLDRFLCSFAE